MVTQNTNKTKTTIRPSIPRMSTHPKESKSAVLETPALPCPLRYCSQWLRYITRLATQEIVDKVLVVYTMGF